MRNFIKTRIQNYEIALNKIQQAIDECCKNDLWDIINDLKKGESNLLKLIDEDNKKLNKE